MANLTAEQAEKSRATRLVMSEVRDHGIFKIRSTLINVSERTLLQNQQALDAALNGQLSEAVQNRDNLELSQTQAAIIGARAGDFELVDRRGTPPSQKATLWHMIARVFGSHHFRGISPAKACEEARALWPNGTTSQADFCWFVFRAVSFYRFCANQKIRDPILEGLLLVITETRMCTHWFKDHKTIEGVAYINHISPAQLYFVVEKMDGYKWVTRSPEWWKDFAVHSSHRPFKELEPPAWVTGRVRDARNPQRSTQPSVPQSSTITPSKRPITPQDEQTPSKRPVSQSQTLLGSPVEQTRDVISIRGAAGFPPVLVRENSSRSQTEAFEAMPNTPIIRDDFHKEWHTFREEMERKIEEAQQDIQAKEIALQNHDIHRINLDDALQKAIEDRIMELKILDDERPIRVAELEASRLTLKEMTRRKHAVEQAYEKEH